MRAALLVRCHSGRINDFVHAAVITQALPLILADDEHVLHRPSLASGNDSGRRFDLETTHRIAEFKAAMWKGADTMRQRNLVADLVGLALESATRRAELYVVGPKPIHYLCTSMGTVRWALERSSGSLRARFNEQFGNSPLSIKDFTAGPAAHVKLRDLTELLPTLTTFTVE